MDGQVSASIMADAHHLQNILITCDAQLKNLSIDKLFNSFEEFGQDYLTSKHIKGKLNASVQFASVWNEKLEIDPDKVYASCDISINNGELVGFTPFIEIADDLAKDKILNKLIEVNEFKDKMKRIKFNTLENTVEIRKQKISIPPMQIKSSAMNIDFNGWHTFNNEIDYHFSFLLSEIFTKSEKKRKEANKEFGEEEENPDVRTLYYTMTGTTDNPVFKKDFTAKREKRKEEIKKEKETLKQILNEEFGWFKKDSTIQKKKDIKKEEPQKDKKFILEWDEESDSKKKEEEFD
jgi:hypothetical protein